MRPGCECFVFPWELILTVLCFDVVYTPTLINKHADLICLFEYSRTCLVSSTYLEGHTKSVLLISGSY